MPFERPTLSRLIEQAQTDVAGSLGLYALLRFSPERALAAAQAGLAQGLYGYLDWIALQAVPFTATDEYLDAWAALVSVTRKGASPATGSVRLTGTDGTLIPIGTTVTSQASGVLFGTTAGGVIAAGAATIPIQAFGDGGAAGNAPDGTPLVLYSPIPGVNSTGAAVGALTGGADVEEDDALRSRMMAAYQAPPQGGAASDYVEWATAVPGVTRAWAVGGAGGAGTVAVYIMLDDANAATYGFPVGTDGTATAEPRAASATGDQLAVANALFPVQPVTALVTVYAPAPYYVGFTIGNLPDVTLRVPIQAALVDLFRAKASVGGTLYPSDFADALSTVAGLTHYSMPVPSGPVTAPAGALPSLGVITWT